MQLPLLTTTEPQYISINFHQKNLLLQYEVPLSSCSDLKSSLKSVTPE